MSENKENKSKELEILSPEDKKDFSLQKKKDPGIEVFYKPSRFPWINKINKMIIASFKEYVQAEDDLMRAGISHSLTKERLRNIHTEIETENLERQLILEQLQREVSLASDKNKLAQLEIDLKKAQLEKEIRETVSKEFDSKTYIQRKKKDALKKKIDHEFKMADTRRLLREGFARERIIDQEVALHTLKKIKNINEDQTLSDAERSEKIKEAQEDMEDLRNHLLEKYK